MIYILGCCHGQPVRRVPRVFQRYISRYLDKRKNSKEIRKRFLDYFINENNHSFVRSSPVVPYCDPTVAFVNAGMNQFKGILLGKQPPQFKRVANSQKCVRVGGKHNDLNVVGGDGYHHTFFEMLGSWSFGDYFKKEACTMAWRLLTDVYHLPPGQLYVTYFKGDENLGIAEDLETKEIWKSIGVPNDRILAFGMGENFWEMGPIGPCGPCTEIHIDRIGRVNRASFVNKGLHDLIELWNIVFIEYNRNQDGTLTPLPHKHVDTGMGFERLTSVLQGRISDYDTDNFLYLLTAIKKICSGVAPYTGTFGEKDWNLLNTSYRILADHSRMVTACLADGMIPEQNQKLRRVLRKAFILSETTFKKEKGLLKELTNYVAEHLGPIYPEMQKNIKQVHQIIDYEEEIFAELRKSATEEWNKLAQNNRKLLALEVLETPSIIAAYKEIKRKNPTTVLDGQFAFRLYDTFGVDEETMGKLADALCLKVDTVGFRKELQLAKARSKDPALLDRDAVVEQLLKDQVAKTADVHKYAYDKAADGQYQFPDLKVRLLALVKDERLVEEIATDVYCSLVLDRTSMYTEAGGQVSDRGSLTFEQHYSFQVTDVENRQGYVLHKGFLKADPAYRLRKSVEGTLNVHREHRLSNMRNHTAAHIVNSLLKELRGATCQKSSKVTDLYLNLDVGIFGEKPSVDELRLVEERAGKIIADKIPVYVKEINGQELLGYDNVTLIPGEVYPETNIRLIELLGNDGFVSREPCCGTHVFNTGDIEDFSVIGYKSLGRSTVSIHAVTGDRAKLAKRNGEQILEETLTLGKKVDDNIDKPEVLNAAVTILKQKLKFDMDSNAILPVVVKHQCLENLNSITKRIKDTTRSHLKDFIDMEMQNVLQSNVATTHKNQKYLVHYLRSSMLLDSVPLQRATKLCADLPVLIIAYSDNMVKARCCVPKNLRSDKFNAEKWLKETVASVFKSATAPPKGQDAGLVCNMKAKRVNIQDWDTLLNDSLEAAKKYIENNL